MVRVARLLDAREVEAGSERKKTGLAPVHLPRDAVRGFEMAVAAAIADVDNADLVAPHHLDQLRCFLEDVGVNIDLLDFFECGSALSRVRSRDNFPQMSATNAEAKQRHREVQDRNQALRLRIAAAFGHDGSVAVREISVAR